MFWTDQRDAAFRLFVASDLSIEQIAEHPDVLHTPKSIYNWRQSEEWKAREAEHVEMVRAEAVRLGIATRERRIAELRDRWRALSAIIAARAADTTRRDVPGYSTGYLQEDIKGIGKGAQFEKVKTYRSDVAISRELRAIEQQMAIELGQWQAKGEGNDLDIAAAAKAMQDAAADYPGPEQPPEPDP